MDQSANIQFIRDCFSDFCTLHLAIIGIGFTIFTLLYSFIYSKRTELLDYSEQLKSKSVDPLIAQRFGYARLYILKLAKINKYCGFAIITSLIAWILSWLGLRIFARYSILVTDIIIVNLVTIFEVAFCIRWLFVLIKNYSKEIDI